ncbi:unnamed protein product [Orchesella dallaii]|uniref:non-specific serine/threonine protein kinase n=1 Tax=Orchesella dallaii TaxID=48710 RepID=A0ABP1QHA6_9HEXA
MSSKQEAPVLEKDTVLAQKFRLVRKLGSGSFGEVFSGVQISDGEEVAIKLESVYSPQSQLLFESRVYKQMQGGIGIPRLRWYGQDQTYNVLVIERLGLSLEDLFDCCGRKFSLKTVLQLADQMITRIEYFHSRSYIHRDIKPDNYLMGLGGHSNRVYLIDYGLAKRYRDGHTHRHIKYIQGKSLTGTARYASLNASLGGEQSRRDDLESIGYVFMYFNRGSLPWQGLKAANKRQKYEKIAEKKMSTPINTLCEGFPAEFAIYLNYTRSLMFEEEPDYNYLKQILRLLFRSLNYTYDYVFDWSELDDPLVQEMLNYTRKKPHTQRSKRMYPDSKASQQRSIYG